MSEWQDMSEHAYIKDAIDSASNGARYAGYQMALTDAVRIVARHVEVSAQTRFVIVAEIAGLNIDAALASTRKEP